MKPVSARGWLERIVGEFRDGVPARTQAIIDELMRRTSYEEVRENFDRFGLLDDQVRFLPGWFHETLPSAPIERLALLRLDGDLYDSTYDALHALYPKLSNGGYAIVDDYGTFQECRQAVQDYLDTTGARADLQPIDDDAVYRATIQTDRGAITMELDPQLAPATVNNFVALARRGYYDGLTFHRIAVNFVVQGGSPGANEYAGDGPFTRDELDAPNWRGTVGLSTRGRDTGDALPGATQQTQVTRNKILGCHDATVRSSFLSLQMHGQQRFESS